MLDFIRSEAIDEKAYKVISEMCQNTNIKLPGREYLRYGPGRFVIVTEFIANIRQCQVKIDSIYDDYGNLEVLFSAEKPTHELKVWRASSTARTASRDTCYMCGAGNDKWLGMKPICMPCYAKLAVRNKTGTWLDKY